MIVLDIRHTTTCRNQVPVSFGRHRLMLRPRETWELGVLSYDLTVTPEATVKWA